MLHEEGAPFSPVKHYGFGILDLTFLLHLQREINAIDFLSPPASESKDVIVERTAAVSTDIEGFAVFLYFFYDFLGTRSTISSETIDSKAVLFKSLKEPLQRVLLIKTNICVAIAILNADNQVANNRHAKAITKELLVCRLCIILLCLYELMVEINIIKITKVTKITSNFLRFPIL